MFLGIGARKYFDGSVFTKYKNLAPALAPVFFSSWFKIGRLHGHRSGSGSQLKKVIQILRYLLCNDLYAHSDPRINKVTPECKKYISRNKSLQKF